MSSFNDSTKGQIQSLYINQASSRNFFWKFYAASGVGINMEQSVSYNDQA